MVDESRTKKTSMDAELVLYLPVVLLQCRCGNAGARQVEHSVILSFETQHRKQFLLSLC